MVLMNRDEGANLGGNPLTEVEFRLVEERTNLVDLEYVKNDEAGFSGAETSCDENGLLDEDACSRNEVGADSLSFPSDFGYIGSMVEDPDADTSKDLFPQSYSDDSLYNEAVSDLISKTLGNRVSEGIDIKENRVVPKKIPFRKKLKAFLSNRWTLLVIYCYYITLMGPLYLHWAPLREVFIWNGAFRWECDVGETAEKSPRFVDPKTGLCIAQKIEIASLFTICTTVDFGFSFFGGLFLDILGPKLACLFGSSAMTLGWLLLSLSSESFNAYKIGFSVYAIGVDAAFFGTMPLAYLFPRYENTMLALLVGFRYLSTVSSIMLNVVVDPNGPNISYRVAMLTLVGLMLVAIVLAIVFIPFDAWKKKPSSTEFKEVELRSSATLASDTTSIFDTLSERERGKECEMQMPISVRMKDICYRIFSKRAFIDGSADVYREVLCKPLFHLLPPIFTVSLVRSVYFCDGSAELVPHALKFFYIIMAFAFIVPFLLGVMAQKFSSISLLFIVNITGTMIILSALIAWLQEIIFFEYVAVVFSWLNTPAITNTVYMVVSDTFPQHHLGKISGFICTVGGIIAFCVHPMFEFSQASEKGFEVMLGVLLGISGLAFILLFIANHFVKKLYADGVKMSKS